MTEQELSALFVEFNARFFSGALPPHAVKVVDSVPGQLASVSGRIENGQIFLRASSSPAEMRSALLHEMAHAAVGPDHGRAFYDELRRLQQAGAVLVGCDDVSDMTYDDFENNELLKEAARRIREEGD